MADQNTNTTMETLRDDLQKLRDQIESLAKDFEKRKGEVSADIASKLANEIEHYRKLASNSAHRAYEAGQNGIEEVGEQVRQNPFASIAIAFGAGCVISCLIRHLR